MRIARSERRPPAVLADIAPEAVLLIGAGRAILLQIANPGVGYGVAKHSDFVAHPLKRLHGTLTYIYAMSNGTERQRRSARRQVQVAHAPVKSASSEDSPAYNAANPQLQLWVAATLYDSGMQAYSLVFGELPADVAERVYQEYSILGTALGMNRELWPATRADFAHYWDAQLSELAVDSTVAEVAQELLRAKNAPLWIRSAMPLARFLTKGLLPASVRDVYGFSWSPSQEIKFQRLLRWISRAAKYVPLRVRTAPMRFYLKKLDSGSS